LIKCDEQEQVTRQQPTSKQSRSFRSRTASHRRRIREVLGRKVRITREVHNEQIDHELRDLERGQVLFPPDLEPGRGHKVIVVHEYMHGEVREDRDPGYRSATVELSVAEKHGSGVVKDVKEKEGFLLDDEEEGVGEFPVFEEVVDHVVELEFGSPGVDVTDSIEKSMGIEDWNDLFEHEY